MFTRRQFLAASGATALSACPLCRAAASPHWSYDGADGPSHWGDLSPDFRICSVGTEQSPVDLGHPVPSALNGMTFAWTATPAKVVNNGHTLQVNLELGSVVQIDGLAYGLRQFHFHHPAEHTINGVQHEMEAHFVHTAPNGDIAAVAVFIVPGQVCETLLDILAKAPATIGEAPIDYDLNPSEFLPVDRAYYRYAGSLTTPPCDQNVLWTVFAEPIEASADQIKQFAAMFPWNARPAQKLNRRFILGTF